MAWVTVDDAGYIYALDSSLASSATHPARMIKLAPGGGSVVSVTPLLFPSQLPSQSYGIDVAANGRIYLSDPINRRVQMIAPDGAYFGSFGFAGDAATVGALSGDLRSVLVDDAVGRVYVVDAIQSQIEVYTLGGVPLFHFGEQGTGPGQLRGPRQLTLNGDGDICVTEYGGYRIQCFDVDGNPVSTFPSPSPEPPAGQLGQPRDIAIDPTTGNLWVADSWNERFQQFSPTGALLGTWGFRGSTPPYGLKYPRGIGFDPVNHRVWITNNAAGTIYVYDDQGNFLFQLGDESIRRNAQAGYFEKPEAIAFGNGYAYVTDTGNQYPGDSPRVKILDALTGTQVGDDQRSEQGRRGRPRHGLRLRRAGREQDHGVPGRRRRREVQRGERGHRQRPVHGPVGRGDHRQDPVRQRQRPVPDHGVHDPGDGRPDVPRPVGRLRHEPVPVPQPVGHDRRCERSALRGGRDQRPDRGLQPRRRQARLRVLAAVAHRDVARERRHRSTPPS